MNIDYNDQRFQQVNNEKQTALNNVNNTYNQMINQSDKYYNDLSKATEDYGKKQQELQQQRTDFTINQINQQQEYAKQDYTKEQKGAYQDYMKQTDQYGVNAEQMAQNGLLGTGYAESSKVSMYNAYQNRIATARESFNRSWDEYENQKTEAMIANSSTMAQLAFDTLKAKLEYSLQGFQYKNDLLQTQLKMQNETEDRYYTRWQNVLNQLNTEAEFKENQRQYNEKMAYQRERDAVADRQYAEKMAYQKQRDAVADAQWQKEYALSKQKISNSIGSSSISKTSTSSNSNVNVKAAYSPNLSTSSAQNWYIKSGLDTPKGTTAGTLQTKLKSAYDSKIINDNDVDMILRSFGLS